MANFRYAADFDCLFNMCSLRVHKEMLLQVPWAEVVEVHSVVEDEECEDDEKCILWVECLFIVCLIREANACLCLLLGVAGSMPIFGPTNHEMKM